jgi:tetratricopeptide (TPR) repeat protein
MTSDLAVTVGEFLRVAGQWDAAERVLSEAAGESHTSGNRTQDVGALRIYATLQWKKGNLAEAEGLLRQALARGESLDKKKAEEEAILSILGEVLRERGDLRGAREVQSQVLAIYERTLGLSHPNTVAATAHLGFVCLDEHDLDAAEGYLHRALELGERIYGVDHAKTSNILNGLAMLSKARHDLPQALALCQRALLVRERAIGRNNPDVVPLLFNLGRWLFELKDYVAAEPVLRRAIKIAESSLGLYNDTTAQLLLLLVMTLVYAANYGASMEVLRLLLSVHETMLGRDHPQTVLDRQLIDTISSRHRGLEISSAQNADFTERLRLLLQCLELALRGELAAFLF